MYIRDMISIQTGIRIARPRDAVFALLADPLRFPLWNSAVTAVEGTGPSYVMHRALPTGAATNELVVVAREAPEVFAIRTASGPTPFAYEYRLSEDPGGTVVELEARVELGPLGRLAARGVKRGIDANLATLRDALERERA
jgi:carbon monoxide dehydrogenase subunit G